MIDQSWKPHPLDKWGQVFLMEIAHSAAPPDSQPGDSPNWCSEVLMPARDGWQVCFFYDCGELDYIDHFIAPAGERLEVWLDMYEREHSQPVMNWRGTMDTERLSEVLHNPKVKGNVP